MADVSEFLAHNIEGYLFGDIRRLQVPDAATVGVGYPLLMTVFSGIEFLGALLSDVVLTKRGPGDQCFRFYWRNHLYPAPSPRAAFGDPLYQLVRHGIAHSFSMKGELGVLQRTPQLHLALDSSNRFVIDAAQLGDDLIASYQHAVRPVIDAPESEPRRQALQARLNTVLEFNKAAIETHWKELATAPRVDTRTVVNQVPRVR